VLARDRALGLQRWRLKIAVFFDSVDEKLNDKEGVYVDDVRLSVPCE
jgi:hypothetical protein